jgi:hypothetical protein
MEADTRNTSRAPGGGGAGSPPCPTTGPPAAVQASGAAVHASSTSVTPQPAPSPQHRVPPAAERLRPGPSTTPASLAAEAGADSRKPSLSELGHRLLALVGEYKEYAAYYLGTRFDGVKVSLRNVGIYAALGIIGLIALSAVVTTAVVLLLVGSAWGLGVLFRGDYGPRIWLGALLVGLLVLGGLAAGVLLGLRMLTSTFRKAMVKKYEQRKRWQRGQFGRNVDDAAATAPASRS